MRRHDRNNPLGHALAVAAGIGRDCVPDGIGDLDKHVMKAGPDSWHNGSLVTAGLDVHNNFRTICSWADLSLAVGSVRIRWSWTRIDSRACLMPKDCQYAGNVGGSADTYL